MERAAQTLVSDASAVLKWFVEEVDSDKAVMMRNAHRDGRVSLAAPDLLVYEVANALSYNPKVSSSQLTASIHGLLDIGIDLVPPAGEYGVQIGKTARKFSISAYDASYAALSEMIPCPLVTADKKLYEKLHKSFKIHLITDLDRKWTLP